MGRGLIKPAELVAHCAQNGLKAACITDYGNLNAAVQLNKACQAHGLLPIFGMEVNLVADMGAKKQERESLVLLAKNRTGFYNLVKLATIGAMYFYYIPRVDLATVREHAEGLIALSSDINGVAAHAYFRAREKGLEEVFETYAGIFGDDFYFELEPVPTESQRVLNEGILECAELTPSMRVVATGDPHYLIKEHADMHRALMRAKNFRNQAWEYPFKGPYHVRSRDEMFAGFSELHGLDAPSSESFREPMAAPDEIVSKVEAFDLREGTKVPAYRGG